MKKYADAKFRSFLNENRGKARLSSILQLTLYTGLLVKAGIDKPPRCYDERYSLAYLSLTYSKLMTPDDLIAYMKGLEIYYGLPKGIITSELIYVLRDADNKMVESLFAMMGELDIRSSEELYAFYTNIIDTMSLSLGKDDGLLSVNASLSQLIGALAQAEEGMTLYDGFCGTGRTIHCADRKCRLYLQDIDILKTPIAATMSVIRGCMLERIGSGDSLMRPLMGNDMRYDRIVSELPLGQRMSKDYLNDICINNQLDSRFCNSDTAPILQILDQLAPNGVAVLHINSSLLFKSGKAQYLRECLIENNLVDCVIELPTGVVPHTAASTAIMILKMGRTRKDVLLIDSKEHWSKNYQGVPQLNNDKLAELVNIYRNWTETEHSGFATSETILRNEATLTPRQYMTTSTDIETVNIERLAKEQEKQFERLVKLHSDLQMIRRIRDDMEGIK